MHVEAKSRAPRVQTCWWWWRWVWPGCGHASRERGRGDGRRSLCMGRVVHRMTPPHHHHHPYLCSLCSMSSCMSCSTPYSVAPMASLLLRDSKPRHTHCALRGWRKQKASRRVGILSMKAGWHASTGRVLRARPPPLTFQRGTEACGCCTCRCNQVPEGRRGPGCEECAALATRHPSTPAAPAHAACRAAKGACKGGSNCGSSKGRRFLTQPVQAMHTDQRHMGF